MKHLALCLLLVTGCASAPPLDKASAAVDKWGDATERLRGLVIALCKEPPMIKPDQCEVLVDAYNESQAAFAIVDAVVP